jgi:hypothetical protein
VATCARSAGANDVKATRAATVVTTEMAVGRAMEQLVTERMTGRQGKVVCTL